MGVSYPPPTRQSLPLCWLGWGRFAKARHQTKTVSDRRGTSDMHKLTIDRTQLSCLDKVQTPTATALINTTDVAFQPSVFKL
jgi:hypothetical protein